MLTRTVLAALAATAVAAGGSTTAVLVAGSPNDTALTQRAPRAAEAQRSGTAGTAGADGAETAAVTPPPCPADVKNHGAYVSSVARGARADGVEGADRGALVSAAAQSDCGKPAGGDDDAKPDQAGKDAAKDAAKAQRRADQAAARADRAAAKAAREAARDARRGPGGTGGTGRPTP